MNKSLQRVITLALITASIQFQACNSDSKENDRIGADAYDSPRDREIQEFNKIKDPALGYVPHERLSAAIAYTDQMKGSPNARTMALNWTERGPIYDSVGPSNGNPRGGSGNPPGVYTSGRIRAILIDPTDPTDNTVFIGGVSGGLWKTTNFLSTSPNWVNVDDNFSNLAISSICMDPSNSNIMYFSTGEPAANSDAVWGKGVWKSTNHGITWTFLPSTSSFSRGFKVLCDNEGRVYLALRQNAYYGNTGGLRRSTNGGTTWEDITATPFNAASSCTDIEISSTGTLHASFGFYTGSGSVASYRYTTNPGTVSTSTWSTAVGLPTEANRIEIATSGDVVYLAPTSTANNVYGLYLSTDGGQNFRAKQSSNYTTSLTNTQGWYNISLTICPYDAAQVIVGGLDAYRSLDSGATIQRMTYWVTTPPYVHADHHYVRWWKVGAEDRILMGTDGGLYYSNNNGSSFSDRNKGLGIKQFYSIAVHPTDPNYFLAGAQDNGVHQLKYEGLGPSTEVTGGDGAYVHINQRNPSIQFGSYVYGAYRRSTNGGANWSPSNISTTLGMFINPWDYDDSLNILYACHSSSSPIIKRWTNAHNTPGNTATTLNLATMTGGASAFKLSPHTPNRLFIGSTTGKLIRVDNVDTLTDAYMADRTTDLSSGLPGGSSYLNCIAIGTDDNNLLAVYSNYGINNVYHSTNGGLNWTPIDGNLPDMPIRWAVFHPTDNDRVLLATEAGVYSTLDLNGGGTQWMPSPGFPTVKTNMLKVRKSDNTVAAATHGRGVWTAPLLSVLPVRDLTLQGTLAADGRSSLTWSSSGASNVTRYRLEYSTDGLRFGQLSEFAHPVQQFRHYLTATNGYYRVIAIEPNSALVYSNTVLIRNNKPAPGIKLQILPNPITSTGNFIVSSSVKGNYAWSIFDSEGKVVDNGRSFLAAGASETQPLFVSRLSAGRYTIRITQDKEVISASFIKK